MAHVADIEIQSSQVTADLTDFPVLIDLSDLPASFWDVVANGGGDIRAFKSDGTTELAREVVSCNTGDQAGELWVKYTGTLSSSSNTIIQIHADGASSDYAATATYGRNAVWSDYECVFHGDDGVDSAGNSADLVAYSRTSFGAEGLVGRAFAIPKGDNNHVSVTSSGIGDLTTSTDLTVQGIVYRNSNTASDSYEEVYASIARPDGFTVGVNVPEHLTLYTDGSNTDFRSGGSSFALGAWIQWHVAWSQTGQSVGHYVDGQLDGSLVTGYTDPSSQNNPNIFLGSSDGYITNGLDGLLDEFRIRYGILSESWIATEHNNQSSPSTFYTVTAVSGGTAITADTGTSESQSADPSVSSGVSVPADSAISVSQAPDPTVSTVTQVNPTTAESVSESSGPAIASGAAISPTTAQGESTAPDPAISAGVSVSATTAQSESLSSDPDITTATTISPTTAVSESSSPDPVVSAGASIAVDSGISVSESQDPTVTSESAIIPTTAFSASAANDPVISTGVSVLPTTARSESKADDPSTGVGVVVNIDSARSESLSANPEVTSGASASPETATSESQAPDPQVSTGVIISVSMAQSVSAANDPTVSAGIDRWVQNITIDGVYYKDKTIQGSYRRNETIKGSYRRKLVING